MQCIENVLRNLVEQCLQVEEDFYDGPNEASFEAKTSEEGIAGDRNRRGVLVVGGRSIRIDRRIDNGYTVSEYLTPS